MNKPVGGFALVLILASRSPPWAGAEVNGLRRTRLAAVQRQAPARVGIRRDQLLNPSSIGGTVSVIPDLYRPHQGPAEEGAVGRGIFVELWKVRSLTRKDEPSVRYTGFVEKVTGARLHHAVAENPSRVEIAYEFPEIPDDGNLAVLVYLLEKPAEYGLVEVHGDSPPGPGLRDASDVLAKVDARILGAAIRLVGKRLDRKAGLQGCDLSVTGVVGPVSSTRSLLSGLSGILGKAADELTSIVPEGAQQCAGFFMDAAGSFVVQVGSIALNLVLYGQVPRVRILSQAEYDWARDRLFGDTLPDRGDLVLTNLAGVDKRFFTIPNGMRQIYMNLGDAFDDPAHYRRTEADVEGQVFMHELTHAWQIAHHPALRVLEESAVNQYKATVLGDPGVYGYECGKEWSRYDFEKQGTIVEVCFHQQSSVPWAPSPCEIELVEKNIRLGKPFGPPVPPSFGPQDLSRPLDGIRVRDLAASPTAAGTLFVLGSAGPGPAGPRRGLGALPTTADPLDGGYPIYQWSAQAGLRPLDGKAVKVAVDRDGSPWVVNSKHAIFRRVGDSWQLVPGAATDLAAGAAGSVWIVGAPEGQAEFVGATVAEAGGYRISRWNGHGWQPIDGAAVRIAVDQAGAPWVINGHGSIFRRRGGAWETVPGSGKDIACGGGKVFLVGTSPVPGGYRLQQWDEAGNRFTDVELSRGGGGTDLAVDGRGTAYVVTAEGRVDSPAERIR